ncbi:MAG: AsmA-like C-terminal domain-containing protein [Geobacteraceae bacterium]|nr:AsmA-like C-terminal domain-containing protein [Geobacteraceae bacterium]
MTKTGRRIRTLLISLALLLALLSVGYIVLIKVIDLDTYKDQILSELQKSLNRPVSYKTGNLSFSLGPAISFHNVIIREPDNSADFVTIKNLTCQLDLIHLLKKQIVIHRLSADKARVNLERRTDGRFNISDLTESRSGNTQLKIHDLELSEADITFTDRLLQTSPIITRLEKTDLLLQNLSRDSRASFKISTILGGGASGTLHLSGKIGLPPKDSPLENSVIEAKISCKKLDIAHYWPYYSKYVPFKKILGTVDTETDFRGRISEFTSTGKIALHSPRFDYQPVFKQVLASKDIQIKYHFELNRQDIRIKALEVNVDGAEVKGSFALLDYRSNDPRITAQAVTGKLDFEKYRQFVPYGIIVKDTAEWIEQHIAGGVYQLDEGKLDGKISQILHMELGTNYNILYIRARAEKGVVSYGSKVPTFNNIKGTLEMKGKDFFLHGMSGNFGTSPMTLEGKIADYPLDSPSSYPFKMVISPSRNEIAWLAGKGISSNFLYNGNSSLTLSGDGFTSGYNLYGDWNLTPASYSYANYISKPVGTTSNIKFRGMINQKEATLTSMNYTVGGLTLDLSAKYPFDPAKSMDILINSNQFTSENISSLSPFLSRYTPTGRAQVSLKVSVPPAAGKLKLNGTVMFNNASLRYSQSEKPVSGLTGSISFDDGAIESTHISARIGNTAFSGKGAISSLDPFTFSTSFTSTLIDPEDFGIRFAPKNPMITKVKGDISFKENSINIKSLSGAVNNSQLSIVGSISDLNKMKADISIYSSFLDISDLILFSGAESTGVKQAKPAVSPSLKINLKAERGVISGTEFKKLNTTLSLSNKVLQIAPLDAEILGGKLSAKGKIDSQSTPSRYQAEFKLANASADETTNLFSGKKKEVTGVMSLEGELGSSGDSFDTIKKSLSGKILIHSTKGMLRQFSGLSKVFSILNVSQLFKFRLPDMVSEGMPYSDIKGTLTFKDGIITTNDLFISSNAMNISFVGKHDLKSDNLDLTVGVQPLQTVDKVVSHIPIVGWILTGKEKSLISAYFEIKGKSTSPEVSAIPVSSLGKGVFGIFKRMFQLPAKLFTDTGEVILGN